MRRVAILLLLLVACGGDGDSSTTTTPNETTTTETTNPYQRLDSVRGSVEEITLSDGTRCAVAWVSTGGGIDCDWGER